MPDDTPEDAIDAAAFDDTPFNDVTAAMGSLSFLDPAAAPDAEPMPDEVWSQLRTALGSAAAERAAEQHANVVVLARTSRPSRPMRWAGGLVAASVAIVAVGLAVGTIRGNTNDSDVVAGGAPAPSVSAPRAAELEASPEAAAAQDTTTTLAATVPAARIVMASNTNYLPEQLPRQVVSLVKDAGFTTPEEAMAKVVPPASMPVESGFTASWEALRACLTWLTQSPNTQALIVDRATFAGNDAGVIVTPATTPDSDPTTPSPTVTFDTKYGAFDVWVVSPDCQEIESNLDNFQLYEWKP